MEQVLETAYAIDILEFGLRPDPGLTARIGHGIRFFPRCPTSPHCNALAGRVSRALDNGV